jgi:hypothetical protein
MIGNAINDILVATTPQSVHVQLCKALVARELQSRQQAFPAPRVEDLLPVILKGVDAIQVNEISVTYPDTPMPPKNVLDSITYVRAFYIAMAQFVSSGFLLPAGELRDFDYGFTLKESIGGTTHVGSMSLRGVYPWLPSQVMLGAAIPGGAEIYDADLFLISITSSPINPDISTFLRDAVECFRHDLFRPTIVMLGAANEGVWIELGRKVATVLPPGPTQFQRDGFLENIENPRISIAAKQELICESFSHVPPEKQKLWRKGELQECKEFAKYLREDRNALHFGKSPVHDDTFAKTAVLMLQAGAHIRRVNEITSQL